MASKQCVDVSRPPSVPLLCTEAVWNQQQARGLESQHGDPVRTVQLYWKAALGVWVGEF